jgi:hypothetical protein
MSRKFIIIVVAGVVAMLITGVIFFMLRTPLAKTVGPPGSLNVKDYGAYGDGKHNDEAAILKAIMTAKGKVVYFPAGNYLISKSFVMPSTAKIKGEGGAGDLDSVKNQSYLMTINPNDNGTVSWGFKWISP